MKTLTIPIFFILAIPFVALAQTNGSTSACANGMCMETESFSGTPNLSGSTLFDQFDPSLGTLLSIKVKAELTSEGGSFEADNDSNEPAEFEVTFGAEGTISSTDVGLFSSLVPIPTSAVAAVSTSESAMFSLTGDDGDDITQFNTGGTDWDAFEGTSVTDIQMGNIDPSLFSGYEGTGTFSIDYDVAQIGNSTSGGGVFRQIDPVTALGNVMVTYEYEPFEPVDPVDKIPSAPAPGAPVVPEPASNLLLLMGGVALVLRHRARR